MCKSPHLKRAPAASFLLKFIFASALFSLLLSVCLAEEEDYYKIMGLSRNASEEDIRKVYRKLTLKFHPDKNKDPKASEQYAKIQEAYQVLSNSEKRQIYDKYGKEGLQNAERGNPEGGFDFFTMFGFGKQKPRGRQLHVKVNVSLETLYNGGTVDVSVKRKMKCPQCHGSGGQDKNDAHRCGVCRGNGQVMRTFQVGPGMFQQFAEQCKACGGKGRIVKNPCTKCHGERLVTIDDTTVLPIDKGMPNGLRILKEDEEKDPKSDVVSDALVFEIQTEKHARFHRDGNNLYLVQTISLGEALLGFERKIKHLDNSIITLKHTKVTQPNNNTEVHKGKGMPRYQHKGVFGDLFVEYQVVLPEKLSEEERRQLGSILKKRMSHLDL